MLFFPEVRAQFLSLQREWGICIRAGCQAPPSPATCPRCRGGTMGDPRLLSPRFQRHVHTYRILPDDEGLLSVQVGAAVGAQRLGAAGVHSLPCLAPPGAVLGGSHRLRAGARAGCRCEGCLPPPLALHSTQRGGVCLPSPARDAVCFLHDLPAAAGAAGCERFAAASSARGRLGRPPPHQPHGCHQPAWCGAAKRLSPSGHCHPPQHGHTRPDPHDVCPTVSVPATSSASLSLFGATSWFLPVAGSQQPPLLTPEKEHPEDP